MRRPKVHVKLDVSVIGMYTWVPWSIHELCEYFCSRYFLILRHLLFATALEIAIPTLRLQVRVRTNIGHALISMVLPSVESLEIGPHFFVVAYLLLINNGLPHHGLPHIVTFYVAFNNLVNYMVKLHGDSNFEVKEIYPQK